MFRKFLSILCLALGILIVSPVDNVFAAVRLANCTFPATPGTGADGSDCEAGLICDKRIKVCTYTSEVACKGNGSGSCALGMICADDNGKLVSSATTSGTCQSDVGGSADNNALTTALCNVTALMSGGTGRASFAIIFMVLGATFLMGKMQLSTLMAVGAGAGLIFGANQIVAILVGKDGCSNVGNK